MDEPPDPLWRLLHDPQRPARRRMAWLVWTYEHAPLRDALIGPEGVYLLDGVVVTAARAFIEPRSDGVGITPPEPASSGATGNIVFGCAWFSLLAIIFLTVRAFR